MLDGNVPEMYTQLQFEQNNLYLNTTGNVVHKADNGSALLKKRPNQNIHQWHSEY